jgi:hypothetical protein
MSLDVVGCYHVCRLLGLYVNSDALGLVISYLERNLWEYPVSSPNSPDSSGCHSWNEFCALKLCNPTYFQWDPHSWFFEDVSNEEENEEENEGENEGENEEENYECISPSDVLTFGFGNTDIYIKIKKEDQPLVRHYLTQNRLNIPSTLDIFPSELNNNSSNKKTRMI